MSISSFSSYNQFSLEKICFIKLYLHNSGANQNTTRSIQANMLLWSLKYFTHPSTFPQSHQVAHPTNKSVDKSVTSSALVS
ncbi:MAG: hypothetical protein LBC61_02335 [Candidatus Peribacteria bacterium]|nr:hypothetical protein [Candidatus Peribacteria bacterium]